MKFIYVLRMETLYTGAITTNPKIGSLMNCRWEKTSDVIKKVLINSITKWCKNNAYLIKY